MNKPSKEQSVKEELKNLQKVHSELLSDLRHIKDSLKIDANSSIFDEWDSGFVVCAKDTFQKLERLLVGK